MKIEIREKEGQRILNLPTGMLMNKLVISMLGKNKKVQSKLNQIPPEAMEAILAELLNVKKQYGSWELAEVKKADGTSIRVIL